MLKTTKTPANTEVTTEDLAGVACVVFSGGTGWEKKIEVTSLMLPCTMWDAA